jgi:hypothetical protein
LNADLHVLKLSRALQSGCWRPGKTFLRKIYDPKLRCVVIAPVEDRIVHQALLHTIGPTFSASFIEQSFACGAGKGPHRAVLYALKQLRAHPYYCKLDVSRYYPTMRRDILLTLFTKRIRDPRLIDLLQCILDYGAQVWRIPWVERLVGPLHPQAGVPIGSYLSHFCGGLYLNELDHFIKRTLKIKGYLRYMDDFLLFHSDPLALKNARDQVQSWLLQERNQLFKATTGRILRSTNPVNFLGYNLSPRGICPGRKLRRRFRQKIRESARKGPQALYRSLQGYKGILLFRC